MSEPKTHDYTNRYWGHDYIFEPVDGGLHGTMMGWSSTILGKFTIKEGDFLLLQNGSDASRYKVMSISYFADPKDMWKGTVEFAPRTE